MSKNLDNHPASEASREVANLTERKKPHTPVNGVKEFVSLSVTNFDPNYLGTGRTEPKINWKKVFRFGCQSCFFLQKQLIYDFSAGNNYPDSPHSWGGMKFATQISPILNLSSCKQIIKNVTKFWKKLSNVVMIHAYRCSHNNGSIVLCKFKLKLNRVQSED